MVDVDTRSDVYSLGVVLYELLTGQTPFDKETFKEVTFDEVRRMIREDEPPRPSAMVSTLRAEQLSTVTERRKSDQRKYASSLRGELDWIVMRAMEKDRERRYQSAGGLADDLERHLEGEPVETGPPSTLYRLRKLTHGHKPMLMTAAVVFLALLTGTGIAAWQAVRATRAEQQARNRLAQVDQQRTVAERAAAESQAVSEFLVEDLLGSASPQETLGREVTVEEVLENAEREIETAFQGQPVVEATLRRVLSKTYSQLGLYDPAHTHAQRAYQLTRENLGPTAPDTLRAMVRLGIVLKSRGQLQDARKLLQEALARTGEAGNDHNTLRWEILSANANFSIANGDYQKAIELHRQTLQERRRALGGRHPDTIESLHNLGRTLAKQGQLEGSHQTLEEALQLPLCITFEANIQEPSKSGVSAWISDKRSSVRSIHKH